MKSRTGVEEPNRDEPNTVGGDPNLANSLSGKGEPRWMKSRTSIGEPNRGEPNTVSSEPTLENSLRTSNEPRLMKPSASVGESKREDPNTFKGSVREFDDHGTHVAFDAQLETIESSSRAPTIGGAFEF